MDGMKENEIKDNSLVRQGLNISQYVSIFEKSLSYCVALMISIFVGIVYTESKNSFPDIIQKYFLNWQSNPDEIMGFSFLIATLVTIPYFYTYTLKNIPEWTLADHTGEIHGLIKLFCLFEICVMTIFYLLLWRNASAIAAKILILAVNILILMLYFVIGWKERNDSFFNSIYFIMIFIGGFLLFAILIYHNFNVLRRKSTSLINSSSFRNVIYVLSFGLNTLANIIIVFRAKYNALTGIRSNRVKIINSVLSIAAFPIINTYCFLSPIPYGQWAIAIIYFIVYEMAVVLLFKNENESIKKTVFGTFFSVIIMLIIPFFVLTTPVEGTKYFLRVDWIILMGISVYMAAIKYWGYIFHFMKYETDKGMPLQEVIYEMITRFDVCFLGATIFTIFFLIWADRFVVLIITLACIFIFVNFFVAETVLKENTISLKPTSRRQGIAIEIIGILLPTGAFFIDLKQLHTLSGTFLIMLNQVYIYLLGPAALVVLHDLLSEMLDSKGQTKIRPKLKWKDITVKINAIISNCCHDKNWLFYVLLFVSVIVYYMLGVICFITIFGFHPESFVNLGAGIALLIMMELNGRLVTIKLAKYYLRRLKWKNKK